MTAKTVQKPHLATKKEVS